VTRIFLATHSSGRAGPADYYENYLLRHGHDVVRLDHPLDQYAGRRSVLTQNGKVIATWPRNSRAVFNLVWDFLKTLSMSARLSLDVAVGANNFDTFSLVLGRNLRRSRSPRILYFASDFSEDRFRSRLMNGIYDRIEKAVLRRADLVISNTHRAETKRFAFGLVKEKSQVIPNGIYIENPSFIPKPLHKDNFIFVGSVTREHGLYDLLQTLRPIIGSLTIVGQGTDWQRTVELCRDQQIPHQLFQDKSHDFVIDYLRRFEGFGLAPYNLESKWTYYSSPLKIVEYIAAGVPVLTSSVPEIAAVVNGNHLGVVYDQLSLEEIGGRLQAFDTKDFHLKAKAFYANYNSDQLYKSIPL
jgi:glycosyltransferase involved in cell wall biosynthesis